ncbi:unnamed protein product [Lepeophtheirus salmonis]|uniref:(salmon louse) hypothetical protein n=1 Tax=Lepeophtheirus salmonis TaxID=72036 RepID=A0A7R8H4H7_LEPSM|nr:unnamed protein product [Lepeophtheirus salmonis]CAF2860768.1 unnamed protein product [Lepeophtheirus salmonis]
MFFNDRNNSPLGSLNNRDKEEAVKTSDALFYGSICSFISGLFLLMSFSSPYWLASWEETQSPFKNMGLWLMVVQLFITLALISSFLGQTVMIPLLLRYPLKIILRFEHQFCVLLWLAMDAQPYLFSWGYLRLEESAGVEIGSCIRISIMYPGPSHLHYLLALDIYLSTVFILHGWVDEIKLEVGHGWKLLQLDRRTAAATAAADDEEHGMGYTIELTIGRDVRKPFWEVIGVHYSGNVHDMEYVEITTIVGLLNGGDYDVDQ